MKPPAVELRNVGKSFGTVTAVQSFDLRVAEGEFVALLGPSGCGKTTTLRMIAGLDGPTSGEILIKGRLVNEVPVHKRNIGMVFQNNALFPHKTAFDNIAFGLRYRNVPKAEISRRVRAALELVQLPHVENRLPSQLSGGQQQRIALARAVVIEPHLLLFDEPLSSLDAALREELRIELKRIQRQLGITAIFVTHDQAEALSMADRIVIMRAGQKEQEGTPEEVYNHPASEFVTRFFGFVNEVAATVINRPDGYADLKVAEGFVVTLRTPKTERVRLLLRAERVRVAADFSAEPDCTILSGTLTSADYLGMLIRYAVAVDGLTLHALQPLEGTPFRVGQRVRVRIRTTDWRVAEERK